MRVTNVNDRRRCYCLVTIQFSKTVSRVRRSPNNIYVLYILRSQFARKMNNFDVKSLLDQLNGTVRLYDTLTILVCSSYVREVTGDLSRRNICNICAWPDGTDNRTRDTFGTFRTRIDDWPNIRKSVRNNRGTKIMSRISLSLF